MSYHVQDFSALDGGQLESYANGLQLSGYCDGMALGQEYSLLQSILVDGGTHFGVSTVSFDNYEELLWMGNQGGHMTSYSTAELQKYTSFQVHVNNEIREIVPHDAGILSLTSNSLRMSARRGLPIFNHCSEQIQNMQCMVLTPDGTLLMGGHHRNLIELDLNTIQEINIVQVSGDNCAILRKHPRFICSGDISGKVTFHDPNTLSVEHVIDCHTGMLSDFDVHGNQLVTCGFSSRHGELSVERFLKVYDLRVMKSMSPIPMMFPPLLLRFVPAYTSRLCAVSQTGQFQMVDTNNSDQYALFIHQVETGASDILTFDTSSSCQAFAFGDAAGYLHLYGASNEVQFNQFSRPTEFADSVEPLQPIDINDEVTPLSTIPLPNCEGKLLSDWPPELCQVAYRPTPPIDPLILNTMKMVGSIGYAPNPANRRRNQVPYQLNQNKLLRDSPVPREDGPEVIPARYLKQEIKYTKMGLDEIDFNRYNRTSFSGLEANLPNAYCNNLIQVLYFIEPLRCALLNHLCQREFCLACELGFLFHMLDTAQGLPCQASNFLRAFRTIPEASAHGLIINELNESKKRSNLPTLVQSWTRFMLQQLHTETLEVVDHILADNNSESTSVMTQLFGAKLFSCNSCRCRSETCQETTTLLTQLLYPDNHMPDKAPVQYSFTDIVQRSLAVKHHITAWCENCSRFTSMIQTKFLKSLPDILVLNCGDNKHELEFWRNQFQLLSKSSDVSVMRTLPDVPIRRKHCRYGGLCKRADCRYYHEHKNTENDQDPSKTSISWIPLSLKLKLKAGEVIVEDQNDNNSASNSEEEDAEVVTYDLTAVVSVISDTQDNGRDNIVSCIKVGPTPHIRHKGCSAYQWYLFNDFSIVPITAQEAVYLNFDWKIPCVLYFSRIDLNSKHNLQVFNPVEKQVFREDVSLAARSGQTHMTFTPLTFDDDSEPAGQLVAMDAEFVTLNQEEAEIRSDGTRSTIRPSQLSVARISCVRGDGPLEGVPFIDDYISTQEQVVDYLTKFSGIQPGDLDASISSKHLTTLKATYQKLRFLIDTGVTFVGHGLKNDFRVINLVVPPAQVLDTVYLFQLPNKRMVSLRFLAWHFLDLKIQSETHDSIEDAKTALQLYKKYVELEQSGKIKEALKELYEIGRQLQWKVPGIDD
ncbi:PAN2-PAN3 deadenylation complex catalytic subunit PAN2-like isoform X2 [Stegodyphus dumicola]|uniref:PAN2-PAN3 deadenylation complex catalytic subunit PAN2-like isoform X2 n=1 Tax=Stegodyphus dumicola TaxID=202533 RepID=UPI0015A85EEB|nr:PAN2-PAN3 deadenylation complex catalytic subunit PAN2-like isoform X2 [Stegodyphus dumicola]